MKLQLTWIEIEVEIGTEIEIENESFVVRLVNEFESKFEQRRRREFVDQKERPQDLGELR